MKLVAVKLVFLLMVWATWEASASAHQEGRGTSIGKNTRHRSPLATSTPSLALSPRGGKRAPPAAAAAAAPPAPAPLAARASGLGMRTASALVLGAAFLLVLRLARQTGCAALIVAAQVGMYGEVVDLIADPACEAQLPGFRRDKYLWLFSFMQFVYGKILEPELLAVAALQGRPLLGPVYHAVHNAGSYCLWVFIVLRFVTGLRQSELYRYQLSQLAGCVLGILILIVQSCMGLANLRAGLLWFALPLVLVIVNDSAAYFFGITVGRTPLTSLSPKKTLEGFAGGAVATAAAAFWVAGALARQPWLTCARNLLPGHPGTCATDAVYLPAPLGARCAGLLGRLLPTRLAALKCLPVQVHAVWFSLFASLIAPFHGFLASAAKRAYGKKDFGDSIPGHGGIVDRLDCQVMMMGFAYMYLQSFLPHLLMVHHEP